jgi:GNAT superfamily N-acetyltransferase
VVTVENLDAVTLRAAALADAEALAVLAGELGYPAAASVMRRRLGDVQKSENDVVLVASRADSIVGWIQVATVASLESDVFAEIRGLVVTESERGKGVGSQLVSAAEAWAVRHSCPRLRVRSNVVRAETRRFYEKRGFAVTKVQNVFDKPLSHSAAAR